LQRIETETANESTVEQFPKVEGRQMVMMLAPKKA
jgi:translation initiation factor IF-3